MIKFPESLSLIPIIFILMFSIFIQISGLISMTEVPFLKYKLLNIVFIVFGVYNCIKTIINNPGISEEVFIQQLVNDYKA